MTSDFGDLIRTLYLLHANDNRDSRRAMARVLGIDLRFPEIVDKKAADAVGGGESVPSEVPQFAVYPPPPRNTIPATVRFLSDAPAEQAPTWLESAPVLPQPTSLFRAIPSKQSLLTPMWRRGVLISVLATLCETQDIDLPRMIARISAHEAIDHLPFVRIPTLTRGVHCWIDEGPAMEPFIQDQRQLVSDLQKVAGRWRVNERKFRGLPEQSGSFIKGAPHLVLSDLGAMPLPDDYLADPVTSEDWMEFAAWVHDRLDGRVVVLTPVPTRKYAVQLRRAATLLYWDRKTSVQTTRKALAGIL
jgi:hypothetical protein